MVGYGSTNACFGVILVFEGEAHPYKKNLVKFDGRTRRVEPETKAEILEKQSV